MNSLSINFLNNQISQATGMKLDYYKTDLLSEAYQSVMDKNGIKTYVDLGVIVKKDQGIVDQIFAALTVNYTTLFRGRSTWQFLKNELRKDKEELKILHLACSTGEEVISSEILLRSIGRKASIIASDVDNEAVDKAKLRAYNPNVESSFRNGLNSYDSSMQFGSLFHVNEDRLKVKTELMANTKFAVHDVINEIPWKNQDIVFCRNMLIYLEEKYKTLVLDNIHASLKDGGWLVLGNLVGFLIEENDTRCRIVDASAKVYSKRS